MDKYKQYYLDHQLDLVYRTTLLEGLIATRLETEEVINTGRSKSLGWIEINIIVNIKHTWQYILSRPGIERNTLEEINGMITHETLRMPVQEGQIRVEPVTITGTNYVPQTRTYSNSIREIDYALSNLKPTLDSILNVYTHLMRNQYFNDGNKRTAFFFTNLILMHTDLNVLLFLPRSENTKWWQQLKYFYETGDNTRFVKYLKQNYIRKV